MISFTLLYGQKYLRNLFILFQQQYLLKYYGFLKSEGQTFRSSRPAVFSKIGVLQQSQSPRATTLSKRVSYITQKFSCEFREILKSTYLVEHLRESASVSRFIRICVGCSRECINVDIPKNLKGLYKQKYLNTTGPKIPNGSLRRNNHNILNFLACSIHATKLK